MKIAYVEKRFTAATWAVIEQANEILEEYADQGYTLTLRQLYYQFVARDLIPNKQREYNRLGNIVNDARLAGEIDWDCLEDRTRNLQILEHFNNAEDALTKLAGWYHVDMWARQKYRPEVWIEKDALVGVIERTCQRWDVPYFSCRGYTSQSEMWRAAQRIASHVRGKQVPYILHLGDHDPSGRDMSRDIVDRLKVFLGAKVPFKRLALNHDQVQQYNPPPNPTKVTDSRAGAYIAEFGNSSWELDALEPRVINALIEKHLEGVVDEDQWDEDKNNKAAVKERLYELADNWGG